MVRSWKFGGVTVGVGLVIGLGVAGWMHLHPPDVVSVAVKPGTVGGLNLSSEPSVVTKSTNGSGNGAPQVTPGLAVTTNGTQGSVLGGSTSGSGGGGATPTPEQLPGPSGFHVYDQYKDSASAMYIDVKPGSGTAVTQGSVVTVQYRGWLTDGTEFDESYARGQPFTFTEGAGTVIAGWAEGMYGMKPGGQRRLVVPASQGYGAEAHGPVPANSELIFDVELVSVQ